jgi:hypothetical protein
MRMHDIKMVSAVLANQYVLNELKKKNGRPWPGIVYHLVRKLWDFGIMSGSLGYYDGCMPAALELPGQFVKDDFHTPHDR